MDRVDIEMTIQTVKGIYTYRNDHVAESMIFTIWGMKVKSLPMIRQKTQAFQDDKRWEMKLPWKDCYLWFPKGNIASIYIW